MKSRKEVEELKLQWLNDPCWDIYDTDGFEEHREELKLFQQSKETEWKEEQKQKYFVSFYFRNKIGQTGWDNIEIRSEKIVRSIDDIRNFQKTIEETAPYEQVVILNYVKFD